MNINTSPDPHLRQLTELADDVHQAADNQQWEQLPALLARFDALVRTAHFRRQQAGQLQAISAKLDEARNLATARRDEIGLLLGGLTGKR